MAVVLVVEDEDQVRVLAESYLQQHGHQTRSASTVPEALALLDSGELIDVRFTDIGLKGDIHAGLELAKEAREQQPDLKVLYTTGQGVTDGMMALFVDGFAFLAKPYTVDQLLTCLSAHFQSQNERSILCPLAGIAGPVPTLVPVHSPSSFRGRRGGVPAITNAFGQPLDTPKSLPKFFAAKRLSGLSADAGVVRRTARIHVAQRRIWL